MRLPALTLASLLVFTSAAFAEDPASPETPSFTRTNVDSEVLDALHIEAEECIAVNDFRGAINAYQEAILIEPDDSAAYANMGHAYLILGDAERAREAFRSALDIDPENELASTGLRRLEDPDSAY